MAIGEKMIPAAITKVVAPHGKKEQVTMPVCAERDVVTAFGEKAEPKMDVGW